MKTHKIDKIFNMKINTILNKSLENNSNNRVGGSLPIKGASSLLKEVISAESSSISADESSNQSNASFISISSSSRSSRSNSVTNKQPQSSLNLTLNHNGPIKRGRKPKIKNMTTSMISSIMEDLTTCKILENFEL